MMRIRGYYTIKNIYNKYYAGDGGAVERMVTVAVILRIVLNWACLRNE
jgi:hypothetical protein